MVVAFHGTSKQALSTIQRMGFRPSDNFYDWLGHGVYFWQGTLSRAESWAEKRYGSDWAVIEAEIDLRDCMDLQDPVWFSLFNEAYDRIVADFRRAGKPLPRQHGLVHGLDKVVIDFIAETAEKRGTPIGSVRAHFQEGSPAFPGSAIFELSHVQIAVRNLDRITILHTDSEEL